MHKGWFSYNGTEIINIARVAAYAAERSWYTDREDYSGLGLALADPAYTDPATDAAPWYDVDDADTAMFYGVYPINNPGLFDSTRQVNVTEQSSDGAVVGRIRAGSRTVVFNVLLLGGTEAGAMAGFTWLKDALLNVCADDNYSVCGGAPLCFLQAFPEDSCIDPITGIPDLDKYQRTLEEVTFTSGPNIVKQAITSDGGCILTVQFTAVAGNPYIYSMDTAVAADVFTSPSTATYPAGGTASTISISLTDSVCSEPQFNPVVDPLYPTIIPPPSVPVVQLVSYAPPTTWDRRAIQIPGSVVPTWTSVVPIITLDTVPELRYVRLRFHPDPLDLFQLTELDPCGFCGEFLISYLPANSELILDGVTQTALVRTSGNIVRSAAHLIFSTNGDPMEWPELACGVGYIMTVDVPPASAVPVMAVDVVGRAS